MAHTPHDDDENYILDDIVPMEPIDDTHSLYSGALFPGQDEVVFDYLTSIDPEYTSRLAQMLKAYYDSDPLDEYMPREPPSDLKCWICYDGYNPETDGSDWRKGWRRVCPCNLFAHQDCLHRWVTSSLLSDNNKPCACPQCGKPVSVVSKKSVILTLRDSAESLLSDLSNISVILSLCGCAGAAVYLALYPIGSWTIKTLCSPELEGYLLGQTIVSGDSEHESLVKLEFNSRTVAAPFLVPIALVLSSIDDFYVNLGLAVAPLFLWQPNNMYSTIINTIGQLYPRYWKRPGSYAEPPLIKGEGPSFTSDKIGLTIYPLARIGYLFLYKRYVAPIVRNWAEQMLLVKPSSASQIFGINLVLDNDDDDDDDENAVAVGGEGNENRNQQGNANNNNGGDIEAAGNGENNDADDTYSWAISKHRVLLKLSYTLVWPWLSSQLSEYLFSLPIFAPASKLGFLVPASTLNRNLLASALIIVGRDLFNLLTMYLRYRVYRSRSVVNYFEKKPTGFFSQLRLWIL